jgi:hypothetical protein
MSQVARDLGSRSRRPGRENEGMPRAAVCLGRGEPEIMVLLEHHEAARIGEEGRPGPSRSARLPGLRCHVSQRQMTIMRRGRPAGTILQSDRGGHFRFKNFAMTPRTKGFLESAGRVVSAGDNAAVRPLTWRGTARSAQPGCRGGGDRYGFAEVRRPPDHRRASNPGRRSCGPVKCRDGVLAPPGGGKT